MGRDPKYFMLTPESLRALGSWAADCAERALSVYEKHADADSRPRSAIEGSCAKPKVNLALGARKGWRLHD